MTDPNAFDRVSPAESGNWQASWETEDNYWFENFSSRPYALGPDYYDRFRPAYRYGFESAASRDPERLAGTVAVNVPDGLQVARTLKSRDFVIDYRPPVGIRISPHFYNTEDECDAIIAEIAALVGA